MRAPTRYETITNNMTPRVLGLANAALSVITRRSPGLPDTRALALDDDDGLAIVLSKYCVHYVLLLSCKHQQLLTERAVNTITDKLARMAGYAVAHALGHADINGAHLRYAAEVLQAELRKFEHHHGDTRNDDDIQS